MVFSEEIYLALFVMAAEKGDGKFSVDRLVYTEVGVLVNWMLMTESKEKSSTIELSLQ